MRGGEEFQIFIKNTDFGCKFSSIHFECSSNRNLFEDISAEVKNSSHITDGPIIGKSELMRRMDYQLNSSLLS